MKKQKVKLFIAISMLVIGLLLKLVTTAFFPQGPVMTIGLVLGWGIAAYGLAFLILSLRK